MTSWHGIPYPIALLGTAGVIVLAFLSYFAGLAFLRRYRNNHREHYRKRKLLSTVLFAVASVVIIILWSRFFHNKATFLGLVGAGMAVALREPLLSIAGRLAIFAGHMYSVGDRIEINKLTGDVIDVGIFYTRMFEIGNWIHGDQASGRLVQFPNSGIFGAAVFNYTRDFGYIWDEIMLPITYASNVDEARRIMTEIGHEFTREFNEGAEHQLEEMRRYFVVPSFELKPQVYMRVTDNWVELTMRYVVEPKKRRAAVNFIFERLFREIQKRKDIVIASSTSEITAHIDRVKDASSTERPETKPEGGQKAA